MSCCESVLLLVQIHWLSIINSMVLVFLLIGFVIIILVRTPTPSNAHNTKNPLNVMCAFRLAF